jgi:hypothetical protein
MSAAILDAEVRKLEADAIAAEAAARTAGLEATRLEREVHHSARTGADQPLFTSLLATRALEKAAREVALNLWPGGTPITGAWVLTTDETLVDRLAVYDAVHRQLEVLINQLEIVNESAPPPPLVASEGELELEFVPDPETSAESVGVVVADAVAAMSKVEPALHGLISANRSISPAESAPDAYVTLLAVVGEIRSWKKPPPVLIDETRLLRGRTDIERRFAEIESAVHELSRLLASNATRTDEATVTWAKGAKTTFELARAAVTALSTVAVGSTVSPLMAAASQAIFAETRVSHVIVIKPAGAATTRLVDDRPPPLKDPVQIVTSASIAFATIDAATSQVIRAGVKTGESWLVGKAGAGFQVDPPQPVEEPAKRR